MKKNLISAVAVSLFFLCFCIPCLNVGAQSLFPDKEPNISMDFQNAGLKDILKVLSIQSGLNFIASEALQDRQVTLYLDQVPLKQAMDKLFEANNLSYNLDEESKIFLVKDWGKPKAETITQIFYLKQATVSSSSLKEEQAKQMQEGTTGFTVGSSSGGSSSGGASGASGGGSGKWKVSDDTGITVAVKKLLSEFGSVIEDYRTNSLIVTDTPACMAVISQVVAALDISVPEVLLEVEMVDVSKNVVDKLGFNFGTTPLTTVLTGAAATAGFPFGSWMKFSDFAKGSMAINSGTNSYTVTMDFLRAQSDTKFLARPKIRTLNNETAEIRIATNESIGVTSNITSVEGTGTTTTEAERFETGVILRVTPQINLETGEITMFVYPKVAEATAGNTFTIANQNYQFRDPEERSTKSIVRVKDGETIVLGGLIRNEYLRQTTGLPFLSQIPVIGAFFRHIGGTSSTPDKNKQRELLIFITPRIVKDSATQLAQAKKAAIPQREQDAAVGIIRESAMSSMLDELEDTFK